MDEQEVQPVTRDTAQVVAKLCGDFKLTDLLTDAETVWQGITWMQALLTERDCYRYISEINSVAGNMGKATPQQRAEIFIKVFRK